MRLEQVGCLIEQGCAFVTAKRVPARLDLGRAGKSGIHFLGCRIAPCAHFDRKIVRHRNRRDFACFLGGEGWLCVPVECAEFFELGLKRLEHQRVREVNPGAVQTLAQNILRQRYRLIAQWRAALQLRDLVAHEVFGGEFGIAHAVDEAGVRPVFKEAANEIGEQLLVPANGCVNPHRGGRIALQLGERIVELFAHTVEALKLERPAIGELLHHRNRVCIVGRKGGVDHILMLEQSHRAGEIGDVGCNLVGEDRIILEPADLAELDFCVPIGALDEPHEELAAMAARAFGDPVAQGCAAFLIGLDGKAKAFPKRAVRASEKTIVRHQLFDNVEAQFQPVGFLGIDRKVDVRIARFEGKIAHHRYNVAARFVGMGEGVVGVERRELDRNSGRCPDAARRLCGKPIDRALIGRAVLFCIGKGHRRLAQHIEAVGDAFGALGCGALQSLIHVAAKDKLPAQNAHRLQGRGADNRLAQPVHRALQSATHTALMLLRRVENLACQHQRKSRGIHESRGALAQMLAPVDLADLVADERIGGCIVGHAQQRLGKAHQGNAFLGVEAILLQEGVNPAGLVSPSAFDELHRQSFRLTRNSACSPRLSQPFFDARLFLLPVRAAQFASVKGQGGCGSRHGPCVPLFSDSAIGRRIGPLTRGNQALLFHAKLSCA